MIDRYILPLQMRVLRHPARLLAGAGLTADAMSITGFLLGLCAFIALALGWFSLALCLILGNRLADGLDGAIARETQATDRGAFLDIGLDFVFYALVPFGFALADPTSNALVAAALITAFVGTGSSFLAFSVIASKRGIAVVAYEGKGIPYIGGLAEGAETILVFVLMCLFPAHFPQLAAAFAMMCALATLGRWYQGWRLFAG